jgi:hypothetical protein
VRQIRPKTTTPLRRQGGGSGSNDAVTLLAWVIDTVHVPVPEQPLPDQPVNVDPAAAAAVNVTDVPLLKLAESELHPGPQLIPPGDDVTVPDPDPPFDKVNV